MGLFTKDIRKKMKKLIEAKTDYDVVILEDSLDGFYVKVLSDCPDAFFHISTNGVVVEVDSDRKLLFKRGPACKLLKALIQGV